MSNENPRQEEISSNTSYALINEGQEATRISFTGLALPLSEGEIHFLWWFMFEAGIMVPETREHLRQSWGFCERHSWGWLGIECSYLNHFVHGPAVLYEDLIEHAQTAFSRSLYSLRLQGRLRSRKPCPMCDSGYGPQSKGYPKPEALKRGRDLTNLRSFAGQARPYWEKYACGLCLGQPNSEFLCRLHLLNELSQGQLASKELDKQKHFMVDYLAEQIKIYSRSFIWQWNHTRTTEGEASLITAIGWCCGWRELLRILES
jgi:hypothetical protein